MIDLQETDRVKKELAKRPEAFQEVIENTPLAICITDELGNFAAVNDNYCRMYGYAREEMIGNSFLMVVQEIQKESLQEQHDLFLKFKDEIVRNWVVVRKDGTHIAIYADAEYDTMIHGKPRKITFVWPAEEWVQELMRSSGEKDQK
ncbi:MAG: PAS domain S-box protein [Bacteroidota bacterium]